MTNRGGVEKRRRCPQREESVVAAAAGPRCRRDWKCGSSTRWRRRVGRGGIMSIEIRNLGVKSSSSACSRERQRWGRCREARWKAR